MVAILLPVPLGLLWVGVSMVVYAMNRHHPVDKVGDYTQRGAYRFYGVAGNLVAAAIFIPGGGWQWYVAAWMLAAAIIIPWSLWNLWRIHREPWQDAIRQAGL